MKNHDLGFDKDNLIGLDISSVEIDLARLKEKTEVLLQEISRASHGNSIIEVGAMEAIPGTIFRNSFAIFETGNPEPYSVVSVGVDENYCELLKLPIIEGRNFSGRLASDRQAILINETLKKTLGWTTIEDRRLALYYENNKVDVIGVVKDININSLSRPIPPMIYQYKQNAYPQFIAMRAESGKERQALAALQSKWQEVFGEQPMKWFFVNEKFDALYGDEERLSKLIGAFCAIAILISCFGLLATAALATRRRAKEIGIRKVNGAKVWEVMALLNRDFAKGTIIAFFIATPVAWLAMIKWLQNFAYKTGFSWWIFALAGAIALEIALLTVSWQSWRAATSNPVESLRYE